jgi:hypothetical protein
MQIILCSMVSWLVRQHELKDLGGPKSLTREDCSVSVQAEARGSETAWVRPLDDCPHLQASDFVRQDQLPRVTSACET